MRQPSRITPFARHASLAGLGLVAATLLAACGPADAQSAGQPSAATSSSAAGPAAAVPSVAASTTAATTATPKPATAAASPTATAHTGRAVTTLATLAVKGRAPRTGYDRGLFGQAWADVDRNGCDTRNDMLRRDLTAYTLKAGTNGCLVLTGTLHDPYTGTSIAFVRGPGTSTRIQIDHVVALSDAWQKGAQRWSSAQRTAFANDPLNLLAVDGPTNQRKGDGDAATWLPPRKAYRCAYVARQIAVKHKYGAVGHRGRARRDGAHPPDLPWAGAAHRRPGPPGWRPHRGRRAASVVGAASGWVLRRGDRPPLRHLPRGEGRRLRSVPPWH